MALVNHNTQKLEEIIYLLEQVPDQLYTQQKEILNGATIGQHFRHIIEFYTCLKNGNEVGFVCYDKRERDINIENDIAFAIKTIENIISFLSTISSDKIMVLQANYETPSSNGKEGNSLINTSLHRELAYALDHTIHHLAIINIALIEDKEIIDLPQNFGVAPSTIRYKKQMNTYG